MEIGERIGRLRREKGATQEEFARAIGVSAPAVSKWEAGKSCPDLMLIVPIARYFGISTDELLGYCPEIGDEALDALMERLVDIFANDGWEEGVKAARAACAQYPGNERVALAVAAALGQCGVFAPDAAARDWCRNWQAELLERAAGAESPVQSAARYMLATVRIAQGDMSAATSALEAMDDGEQLPDKSSLLAVMCLREGNFRQAEAISQRRLYRLLLEAGAAMAVMAQAAGKAGNSACVEACAQGIDTLAKAFDLEGALAISMAQAVSAQAESLRDDDLRMKALNHYGDAALNMGTRVWPKENPLFSAMDESTVPAVLAEQRRAVLRAFAETLMSHDAYDDLRSRPDFQALLRRVEAAGK